MRFPPTRSCPNTRQGAFSLLEMLVAIAILGFLVLAVASVMNHTVNITGASNFRMSADAGSREALDRMGADFSSAILRTDLPDVVEKRDGNDRISFFSEATGYSGDRGVSKLNYLVSDYPGITSATTGTEELVLLRGAEGTTWEAGEASLKFGPPTGSSSPDPSTLEIAAPDVFRMELAFLMGDGSFREAPHTPIHGSTEFLLRPDASPEPQEEVVAVIVAVATLDAKARALLPSPEDLETLAELLPDSVSGTQDILTQWEGRLDAVENVPLPALNAIRTYQRYFYLNPAK